jgi:hypothetical protein
MHHEINLWIDSDGHWTEKERTITMNVPEWTKCEAEGNMVQIELFAETADMTHAGSDDQAKLHVAFHTASGRKANMFFLNDLAGNDYLETKTDWFSLTELPAYKVHQIAEIKLESGGSDGWHPSKAMVVIKTHKGQYQVISYDESNIGWLDDGSLHKLQLSSCPFRYTETLGYWERIATGNGGDGAQFELEFSFTDSKTSGREIGEQKEIFKSSTNTMTMGFETGLEFEGLTMSQKLEHSIEHTTSSTVTNSIVNSIGSTLTKHEVRKHTAPRPDALKADPEAHFTLYVLNIYRKNNVGSSSTLRVNVDYVYKWGPCRDVYPNCISATFCADRYCMTCNGKTDNRILKTKEDFDRAGIRQECRPAL